MSFEDQLVGRFGMRGFGLLVVLSFLVTSDSRAQREVPPTVQDGPMTIPSSPPAAPKPDADGVYRTGPGITPPAVVKAVQAAYPADATADDRPRIRIFAVVVGANGLPSKIHTVFPNESEYDAGAIEAIKSTVFEPGTLNGVPVPVLVHVRVPFFHLQPAMPMVQRNYANFDNSRRPAENDPYRQRPGDTQPRVIYAKEAEFSEEARAKKIEGVVTVSVLVTEEGLPSEVKVQKSFGYGLDEKAIEAVRQYRFKPAMRDGKPVPVRVWVQVNFKLY